MATKPTLGCGVGANPLIFIYTEVGVMGPQANRSNFSGYLSNDFVWPINLPGKTATHLSGHPIALVGYTRMFETGHALDYGIGFEHHVNKDHSLQFELRDYMTFANPTQHNVMFRAVWLLGVQD